MASTSLTTASFIYPKFLNSEDVYVVAEQDSSVDPETGESTWGAMGTIVHTEYNGCH
jgi:hypothetical protein